ncbi:hypothetical protein [Chitiniphilus shinanonensis]|uniref:hypothetical protein n=1 Tax=Chitiniphilus shinanonensis TaxID=553088 RepID=UPI003052C190
MNTQPTVTFVLNLAGTYAWSVAVPAHDADGRICHWTLQVRFRRLTRSALAELNAQATDNSITIDDYVDQVLDGFEPFQTDQGVHQDDAEGRRVLFDVFPAAAAIMAAHRRSIEELFAKN